MGLDSGAGHMGRYVGHDRTSSKNAWDMLGWMICSFVALSSSAFHKMNEYRVSDQETPGSCYFALTLVRCTMAPQRLHMPLDNLIVIQDS